MSNIFEQSEKAEPPYRTVQSLASKSADFESKLGRLYEEYVKMKINAQTMLTDIERAKKDLSRQENILYAVIFILLFMLAGFIFTYFHERASAYDQLTEKISELQYQQIR